MAFKIEPAQCKNLVTLDTKIELKEGYKLKELIQAKDIPLGDVMFDIECFPKGERHIGIYFTAPNAEKGDFRMVTFQIKCGNDTVVMKHAVNELIGGWGWQEAFTHEQIQQSPVIEVHGEIALFMNDSGAIAQQHHKIYEMSRVNGDITLSIKLKNNQDTEFLYSPKRKKRRLTQQAEGSQANVSDDNQGSDCSLEQDEQEFQIKASSIILRSASDVFDRMLNVNMKEKNEKKIIVHAERVADVDDLYYFMCTNKMKKTANPLTLIHLAKFYEMERLFKKCLHQLTLSLSVANFVKTICIFDRYEVVEGYASLIDFAKKNAAELKKSVDFDSIPHSFKCTTGLL